ncbi:hypothetical protein [Variovorax sp. UMC13]|uniref:hypothetical protein n=1 Tax=Variovorax sp. UMC13 TaxID=1862326 RepID=UPI0016010712|nr:hypothetical protein [Variovorax sp. UMC13]MBB1604871.1 hypothetical protein [Variovorax sp. UMC13]
MKMNLRRLAMGLGLGAVVVLAGCAAYPAGTYYDGGGYSSGGYGYGGGYNAYEGGYYPGAAPVIIQQPPVYVNGGYYRRPDYRGDYRGDYRDRDGRPGYNRPPNRPPQNVDRPNRPDPRPPVTRPNRPAPSSGYPPVVPGSPSPVQPNGQYVN